MSPFAVVRPFPSQSCVCGCLAPVLGLEGGEVGRVELGAPLRRKVR